MPIVTADRGRCQGWANCVAGADDVFDIDDDGLVVLLQAEIPEVDRARIDEVAHRCPMSALIVTDS
ncbi:ferredoxin [Pseudonocardia sp. CA-142604]|uniref:ferredoxin n=1 Tax=Pseudonocardia sp. CA-142604 TaxID=3240024 RepID=UPI003D905ABF